MAAIIWKWCDKCKRPTNHAINLRLESNRCECVKCCQDEARRVNSARKILHN